MRDYKSDMIEIRDKHADLKTMQQMFTKKFSLVGESWNADLGFKVCACGRMIPLELNYCNYCGEVIWNYKM